MTQIPYTVILGSSDFRIVVRSSIIVPAVGSQSDIDETLVSVLENRPRDCQVLVAHAADYVDPYDLHDEVDFVVSKRSDPASLCNTALESAHAEVVHFVAPGCVMTSETAVDSALSAFASNRNIGSVIPVLTSSTGRATAYGVTYCPRRGRRLVTSKPNTEAVPMFGAAFYRTTALRFMHGFDAGYHELADVELGLRMRAAGYEHHVCHELRMNAAPSLLRYRPERGLRGGVLRARLSRLACEQRLTSRASLARVFVAELVNNGFRPSAIASCWGHLQIKRESGTPKVRPMRQSSEQTREQTNSRRRAA